MTTYKEAIKYIDGLERFGIRLGLKNIKKILKYLGNPQDNLKIIHIAGTNGKGSTASFIYYILQEAGYRVGLYTSPHLIDFRERIQINGKYICKKDVIRLTKIIKLVPYSKCLTYFEFTTIIAFLYFRQKQVDFAVIEVGMGGRLDATNVIKKSLSSVITNIDFEHTQYLGKTLRKIAFEKCGIIKKNGIVITACNDKTSLGVIKGICRKKNVRLFQVNEDLKFSNYKVKSATEQIFDYQGIINKIKNLQIKMPGKHQLNNALCALGAVEVLTTYGYKVEEKDIRRGLEQTRWPGRLELFKLSTVNCLPAVGEVRQRRPADVSVEGQLPARRLVRRRFSGGRIGGGLTILLDGAHNPAGIKNLKDYIKSGILKFNKLILIFGVLSDKDIEEMLKIILPVVDVLVVTKPHSKRAATPDMIMQQAKKYLLDKLVILTRDIKAAIDKALSLAGRNDLICITGSLYAVGEARQTIEEKVQR